MMTLPELYQIEPYQDTHRPQILTVWERSVLATHHFLDPVDFEAIKELVASIDFHAFQVFCLTSNPTVIGFVGVADNKIEMLFLDPDHIGKGLGRKLLDFAVKELKADQLDVNEQNTNAVAFYQKAGFVPYERTDRDDQGRDYPLLRMRLRNS